MIITLLSGGKGKRLWPISTNEIPKQFINVFENSTSMLKHTYNLISKKSNSRDIYIATCDKYSEKVKKELPNFNNLILEPIGIGTFGAILNVAVYLTEIVKSDYNEVVSIIPIDQEVDNNFYDILFKAKAKIKEHNLCLIGITPTFPSTQYGYIIHSNEIIKYFKEKPEEEEAIKLIKDNALWNSGIIVFKLGYIYDIAKKYIKFNNYSEFIKHYLLLPHNSFDFEVLERESNIAILKSEANWKDLGTWDLLAPMLSSSDEFNTNIVNFENKKIENEGVKNIILINSANGIKIINKINDNEFYRNWGTYTVLNYFENLNFKIKIKKLVIMPNQNISYQYHNFRRENWYILSGEGEVIIDGIKKTIKSSDTICVEIKQKHSIKAIKKLEIIEVQYGCKTDEKDVVRIEYNWDKII